MSDEQNKQTPGPEQGPEQVSETDLRPASEAPASETRNGGGTGAAIGEVEDARQPAEASTSAEASAAPAEEGIAAEIVPPVDIIATLEAEIENLHGQVEDLTGRMLRAHAEMDNLRKRFEREKLETKRYAITNFARDAVEVADNFRRAIVAVPAESLEQNAELKTLFEGVSMIEREFMKVLGQHGVRPIVPKGETYDANFHQAMMERHDPSVFDDTVVEVYGTGYAIEDRCLKPAIVVKARGGPKKPKDKKPDAAGQAGGAEPSDAQASSEGGAHPSSSDGGASGDATKPTDNKTSNNGDAAA
ncbi:MAG: nucleotide exchange factor GrpE [Hyphomicrobiaceae bacterium]|nr:nucleotide exchange factor GrpE [Hyphomicrobiaceae bacterium]